MDRVIRRKPWLALGVLGMVLGGSAAQAPPPPKPIEEPGLKMPAFLNAKTLQADPNDDELRRLLKARYNEAFGELRAYYEAEDFARRKGPARLDSPEQFYDPWRRLVRAGLELYDNPADKVTLLTHYLEATREAEKDQAARYDAGRTTIGYLHRARYERLDAQIQLLRAKREADKAKNK